METLKISDIPSRHSLFRLVPWELSTDETEFLSSHTDLLKTPTAFDAEVTTGKKNPKAGNSGCLAQEVMSGYVKKRMPGLLPTPTAQDNPHPTNKIDENGRRWTEGAKASHSMGLADMAYMGLLPTPRVSDTEGSAVKNVELKNGKFSRTNSKGVRWGVKLKDVVEGNLLSTVCYQKTDGEIFRLNPLFTEEMMGFPLMWTALPYLLNDGKKKP